MKKPVILILALVLLMGTIAAAGIWLITTDSGQDRHDDISMLSDPPMGHHAPLSESFQPKTEPVPGPTPEISEPHAFSETIPVPDFSHLRLIGVAIDPTRPYAIILNEKKETQGLFRPGETIEGTELQAIFIDKVILKAGDQLVTLFLESAKGGEDELTENDALDDVPPAHTLSYMQQEEIETAWQETQELMSQVELSQFEILGEARGVIVENVIKNSVFDNMGLRKGDIILQVDDMEIMIADDAMEIYNCLRTKKNVAFTLIRNGEKTVLRYNAENESF